MNLIKQAINYTKDAWNSLKLSTKIMISMLQKILNITLIY